MILLAVEWILIFSFQAFVSRMKKLVAGGLKIDNVVLNAGVLKYPNVSESWFLSLPPARNRKLTTSQESYRDVQTFHFFWPAMGRCRNYSDTSLPDPSVTLRCIYIPIPLAP